MNNVDREELLKALDDLLKMYRQFSDRVDFSHTFLDASTIKLMNQVPVRAERLLEKHRERKSLQERVGEWGDATFGHEGEQSLEGIVNHLEEEAEELGETHDPEEAADCLMLLFQHAHTKGYDLLEETEKKLEVNKDREWGEPDEDGVVRHVKERPCVVRVRGRAVFSCDAKDELDALNQFAAKKGYHNLEVMLEGTDGTRDDLSVEFKD